MGGRGNSCRPNTTSAASGTSAIAAGICGAQAPGLAEVTPTLIQELGWSLRPRFREQMAERLPVRTLVPLRHGTRDGAELPRVAGRGRHPRRDPDPLRVLSDTKAVATQGPVWCVGGRSV
jgi:hypothetical protein